MRLHGSDDGPRRLHAVQSLQILLNRRCHRSTAAAASTDLSDGRQPPATSPAHSDGRSQRCRDANKCNRRMQSASRGAGTYSYERQHLIMNRTIKRDVRITYKRNLPGSDSSTTGAAKTHHSVKWNLSNLTYYLRNLTKSTRLQSKPAIVSCDTSCLILVWKAFVIRSLNMTK